MLDDLQLIALVKERKELYDNENKLFNDNKHRDVIWRMIAVEMNKPVSRCKSRWISLRDQFRKILRKRQANGVKKKWKYHDQMAFILPHFHIEPECITSAPKTLEEDEDNFSMHEEMSKIDVDLIFGNANIDAPSIDKLSDTSEKGSIRKDDQSLKGTNGAIDKFFDAMAETVKKLSPIRQHAAKSRIFRVVSELEFDELHYY